MNTLLSQAIKNLEAKSSRLHTLLNQGNDLTEAESTELSGLHVEVKALTKSTSELAEAEEASTAAKAFLNDPAKKFLDLGNMDREDSREEIEVGKDGQVSGGIKGIEIKTLEAISSKAYQDAYMGYLRKGQHGLNPGELKTLQVGNDSLGGFLVPVDMLMQLIRKKPTKTRIADMCQQFTTSRDALTIPAMIWDADDVYTSGVRATTVPEIPNPTQHLVVDPNFGGVKIEIFTDMMSGSLTNDILEDAAFNVMDILAQEFDVAQALKVDDKVLNGTGANEQTGLLANPGGSVGGQPQCASINIGSPLSADSIVDLPFNMPEQYEDEDLMWILNKTNTTRGIAKLKDGENRYLFAYGLNDDKLASARPKELVGYGMRWSAFMPNAYQADAVTTNAGVHPLLFGSLKAYALVKRIGMTIQVLRETKALENQIQLVSRYRWGGQTHRPWLIKAGKTA